MKWIRPDAGLASLLQLLYPRRCVLCQQQLATKSIQQPDIDLCNDCLSEFPVIEASCQHCGIPLTIDSPACGQCLNKPPRFDHVFSLFHYQQPVSWMIRQMKFHQQPLFADLLGQLLGHRLISRQQSLPEVLIPVPLHPRRQFKRGFNQAEEVARAIARHLKRPVENRLLRRRHDNRHQSGLDAKARRRNVRGIFEINPTHMTRYQHVAVIDDVLSTGSTATEIARVLKRAGVKRVEIWVIARADAP